MNQENPIHFHAESEFCKISLVSIKFLRVAANDHYPLCSLRLI